MEYLFELKDVVLRNGNNLILDHVSVSFPLGKSVFILGPSGCGKSTLLKVAAGIIPPDSGEALAGGKSYGKMSEKEVREFRLFAGFAFQDSALWANMSVLQNMLLPVLYHFPGLDTETARSKAESLLSQVGYSDSPSRRPAEISAGEQKLVAFARAMVLGPRALLLDAPQSLLDRGAATRIVKICTEFYSGGRTLIVVTGNLEFCFRLADRLCFMNEGRVVAEGPIADMLEIWPDFLDRPGKALLSILEDRGIQIPTRLQNEAAERKADKSDDEAKTKNESKKTRYNADVGG